MSKSNVVSFVFGIVFGMLIAFCLGVFITGRPTQQPLKTENNVPGLVMLKEGEKASVFDTKGVKIMQVLSPKMGLAHTAEVGKYTQDINYFGTLVLYIANDNVRLYDDQIINVPNGKKLMQVGTFEYETKNKTIKTVPAVSIK